MSTGRPKWGTAARLSTILGGVLVAVLALTTYGLVQAFTSQVHTANTRSLTQELQAFASGARARPARQSLESFTRTFLQTRALGDDEILIVALTGKSTYGSSGSTALLQSSVIRTWTQHPPTSSQRLTVTAGGVSWQLVAVPLLSPQRTEVGTVAAAVTVTQVNKDVGRVAVLAAGEAAIAVLASVLACWLVLRGLLERIHRVTATAAELGSGLLDRRLRESGTTDEVGQLAVAFDTMADQLESALTAQRRLLSDVSHQLRTPLTVARGHLEVLERTGADPQEVHETVTLVLDELDHMRELVERLLTLGHSLEPDFITKVPIDLRSFCADLLESIRVLADRRWEIEEIPDLLVDADAAKLRGAVLNLVDNAVHATTAGDVIALSVAPAGQGLVTLAVDDSGPGMPADARATALDRFARPGAADSSGSGLGLAIVRAVAEAHGGSVALSESHLGGLRVAITLPGARPAQTVSRTSAMT
ncbi:MAG TPA: HAMP domain-containing sensor histidine kinase [Mycobacteriales bacterium]|nr:HAMP domain-containing sensor histidine kinase [Mycobacteriales bacterium]